MNDFNHLKQCRQGMMLYNKNDLYVGRSLELYGEFSQIEADFFQQAVRHGDCVVEVGSNIGAHTLVLARLVGREGLVIAFEPQRIVFQTLCANVALNSITCAYCYQQAVGSEPGTLIVPFLDYSQSNNFGGIDLRGHAHGDRVAVVTLDQFQLSKCRLLKVDVEGMEVEVLRGATQTIGRLRPFLYVENDRPEQSNALIQFIDSLGYDMYWHRPRLFNPDNYLKNPENVFGTIVSINMFCVPRGADVALQGFPKVKIPSNTPG
jgi:FkbM family methyltransferase